MQLRNPLFALALLATTSLGACQRQDSSPQDEGSSMGTAASSAVNVIARDFAFDAPDSIPSGWTTIRFTNAGTQTHFVVFHRLPPEKTLQDWAAAVTAPFDSAWGGLQAGTMTKAQAGAVLASMLPPWYGDIEDMGGVGLVAPGHSAQATMNLSPGTYVLECYVKTPDLQFHVGLGMAHQLTVTASDSGEQPPQADLDITFADGKMDAPAEVSSGRHVVAVHYRWQPATGMGNDVNVAQLPDGTTAEDLIPWMDWMNVHGLEAPAPATFVGGVQEAPEGSTVYFTVDLPPGRHAWAVENGQGLVQPFTVQ